MDRVSFTLRLPAPTVQRLDSLADATYGGAARAALVRIALDRFLDEHEPSSKRSR